MRASFPFYAVAIVATVAVSSSAAAARSPASESVSAASGTARQLLLTTTVVPLRVQRLLKTRAPKAAYVPTRLPRGFRYDHYENLGRWALTSSSAAAAGAAGTRSASMPST